MPGVSQKRLYEPDRIRRLILLLFLPGCERPEPLFYRISYTQQGREVTSAGEVSLRSREWLNRGIRPCSAGAVPIVRVLEDLTTPSRQQKALKAVCISSYRVSVCHDLPHLLPSSWETGLGADRVETAKLTVPHDRIRISFHQSKRRNTSGQLLSLRAL